jgi:aminopeptidase-like protein
VNSSRSVPPGEEMMALIRRLYPVCRSITGSGVRETLAAVRGIVPIEVREIPTGTAVLDWTIPREWNIREAWIRNGAGDKIVDFRKSSLHVVSYSVPFRGTLSLRDLRPHLHSLPDRPGWIPYRTSYYNETWGFCLPHEQLASLAEGSYEVFIDSTLEPGSLSFGELVIPGKVEDEILLTTHVCHPSLANDNLSGIAVLSFLARHLSGQELHHTVRCLFIPGTIGSIAWLSVNRERLARIRHGLVLTGLGDPGPLTYKKTIEGACEIDRASAHVLGLRGGRVVDFTPYGYDERQFNSPGFRLPVGRLGRTPHGEYPEYHTSGDNLEFIRAASLEDSWSSCLDILTTLEENAVWRSTSPYGEPQLGRRGIYRAMGGTSDLPQKELALLWVLALADGHRDLLQIAERAGVPFHRILEARDVLIGCGLLERVRP